MKTDLKFKKTENNMFPDLIKYPLMTEKVLSLAGEGLYAFKVLKNTQKNMIKAAVEAIFTVKVKDVRMLNMKGKRSYVKGNWAVRGAFKKAYIQLEPGYKIDMV